MKTILNDGTISCYDRIALPDLKVRHGRRRVWQRRAGGQVPALPLDLLPLRLPPSRPLDVVVKVVDVRLGQNLVVLGILWWMSDGVLVLSLVYK